MSATIAKNLIAVSKTLTAAAAALAAAAADLQKSPAVAAPQWSEEQKKKLTKFKNAFLALDMSEEEAKAAAIKKLGEKPAGNSGSAVEAEIDKPKKRGRPVGSGKKNTDDAAPAPAAEPKGKKALRMITKEDVRNESYTLGEFTKHLREDHGLLPDSEQYLQLKQKFLDTRKKLKAEVEAELAEEQDVSDDEALVGEYTIDGDDEALVGEYTIDGDDEPEEIAAPAPRSRAKAPTDAWEQGF
jgi:DNA-binding protein H-NS